jgi:allene oxide cyclase
MNEMPTNRIQHLGAGREVSEQRRRRVSREEVRMKARQAESGVELRRDNMRRGTLLVLMLFVATAVLAGVAGATSTKADKTIAVVERSTTGPFFINDTGATGDSVGDLQIFANDIYNKPNTTKVGTDQGFCVRVVAGKAWECWWTIILSKGQITVQGPYFDAGPSALAITGGTGAYRNARGWMDLKARNAQGTESDFVYHLLG